MKKIKRIQRKTLKKIKTGIWSAEQRIQYATLMLYHNIENCDEERKIKKMIEEEEKNNYSNTFHKKVQQMVETLGAEIDKVTGKKKSTWKKGVKEKVISKVKKKMIEVMTGKTKAEQKQICRLDILELKANYGRKIWTKDVQYVNQKRILQNTS